LVIFNKSQQDQQLNHLKKNPSQPAKIDLDLNEKIWNAKVAPSV
jgi:hypothetical protein